MKGQTILPRSGYMLDPYVQGIAFVDLEAYRDIIGTYVSRRSVLEFQHEDKVAVQKIVQRGYR